VPKYLRVIGYGDVTDARQDMGSARRRRERISSLAVTMVMGQLCV
jgi:hypothetical protein